MKRGGRREARPRPRVRQPGLLLEAGIEAYRHGHATRAISLLRACRERTSRWDPEQLAEAWFWEGAALHALGRLREAEACLEQASADMSTRWRPAYMASTRMVRVRVERPERLSEIEEAFAAVRRRLHEDGCGQREARLLLTRARLALSRGRWRAAFELARHARAASRNEPQTTTEASFLWVAILSAIWIGEESWARETLDTWERQAWTSAERESPWLRILQAELARRRGSVHEAAERARLAWSRCARAEDRQEKIAAGRVWVQAAILAHELPAARSALRALASYHRAEVTEHAFVYWILNGDVALAAARAQAGLPALDPDYAREEAPPARPGRMRAARAALERAERLYRRAEATGRELDHRLACRVREWQLRSRKLWVERTRRALPASPSFPPRTIHPSPGSSSPAP